MTDADLRDDAVRWLRQTTISYPDWQRRVKAGRYTPKDGSGTAWGKALGSLAEIGAVVPQPGLDLYELTLTPNWSQPSEQNPLLNAVWLYATSPATPWPAPNGRDGIGRYLDFKVQDEWWIVVQREWPSSFDPSVQGGWGTEANGHNVATHDGPDGGVGWGFGDDVSALRVSWNPHEPSPVVELEYAGLTTPLPVPPRGELQTYELHFVAGRVDGSTARPGSLEITVNGKPWYSLTGINTIQRAQGTDGKWYVQRWMQWWDGDYTSNLSAPSTTRFTLTRFGATREQAYADLPVLLGDNIGSQVWNGKQPNVGPPKVTKL